MAHYFTENQSDVKTEEKTIQFDFCDKTFTFTTDHGVFSKDTVDLGTRTLLEAIEVPRMATVLDLGCGYGAIGTVIAACKNAQVTMADVNERAIDLAKRNAKANGVDAKVIKSDGLTKIKGTFDIIVSNPPIRIGKPRLYALYKDVHKALNEDGIFWLVVRKKQGAATTAKYLATMFDVNVVQKHKGYHVMACKKTLTP
ncbi:MAG: class I SAM-dependent methyltransferase [Bacillota bacterium]